MQIPSTHQVSQGKVITQSGATQASWVEEEAEEREGNTMSINSLSMDSNEPDFFNDGSDEMERMMEEMVVGIIGDVNAMFNIEKPPENKDEANHITMPLLSPVEWACLDFYIELLNQCIT